MWKQKNSAPGPEKTWEKLDFKALETAGLQYPECTALAAWFLCACATPLRLCQIEREGNKQRLSSRKFSSFIPGPESDVSWLDVRREVRCRWLHAALNSLLKFDFVAVLTHQYRSQRFCLHRVLWRLHHLYTFLHTSACMRKTQTAFKKNYYKYI